MAKEKRIILVEDDESINTLHQFYIKKIKSTAKVSTCELGQEGLDLIDSTHQDLIILDYNLPDMTGNDFLIKLKEKNPKASVIIASGEPKDRLKKLITAKKQVIDICEKPIKPHHFDKLVRKFI